MSATGIYFHAQKLLETQQERILCLSADNPTLGEEGLYEIAASIFLAGYSALIIDEGNNRHIDQYIHPTAAGSIALE